MRRSATNVMRCLDSERLRDIAVLAAPCVGHGVFLTPGGQCSLQGRIRSWNLNARYDRVGVSLRLYGAGVRASSWSPAGSSP